jgi:hypothetical protein
MLASLECVGHDGINDAATAENVIAAIPPAVYVKGSDSANAVNNVTGKIEEERRAHRLHQR